MDFKSLFSIWTYAECVSDFSSDDGIFPQRFAEGIMRILYVFQGKMPKYGGKSVLREAHNACK